MNITREQQGTPIHDNDDHFLFLVSKAPNFEIPGFFKIVDDAEPAWDGTPRLEGEFALGESRQNKDLIRKFISACKQRDPYFEWRRSTKPRWNN